MKVFSLRNLLVAFVAVLSLSALASCGGFSCSDKGKCKNDTAPDQATIDQCKKAQSGKCGSEFDAVGSCAEDHATCDATTGKSKVEGANFDITTAKFTGTCADEENKLLACCATNPTTDGCKVSGS